VLPVIHAITGCDTTSSLFGIGERSSTEKSNGKNVMGNQDLIEIAGKFVGPKGADFRQVRQKPHTWRSYYIDKVLSAKHFFVVLYVMALPNMS
jgi:hypothetical protein